MASSRARLRIAVNVALDAAMAALAVPLADWLTAPARMPLAPIAAPLWGVAALLVACLPFRLPWQYWRYAGMGELIGVAASAVLGAAIFALGLHVAYVKVPSPSFPVGHALCLLVLLGLPRIAYRLLREQAARTESFASDASLVLLVGAGEGADLFLSALAGSPAARFRAVGLLSAGAAQTGRRIQGCPVLGSFADAGAVLTRLHDSGETPESLVITEPDLDAEQLKPLLAAAQRAGITVARAPLPTALDHRAEAHP
jgi:O-antigen biosynthesis protein WbqV